MLAAITFTLLVTSSIKSVILLAQNLALHVDLNLQFVRSPHATALVASAIEPSGSHHQSAPITKGRIDQRLIAYSKGKYTVTNILYLLHFGDERLQGSSYMRRHEPVTGQE